MTFTELKEIVEERKKEHEKLAKDCLSVGSLSVESMDEYLSHATYASAYDIVLTLLNQVE